MSFFVAPINIYLNFASRTQCDEKNDGLGLGEENLFVF